MDRNLNGPEPVFEITRHFDYDVYTVTFVIKKDKCVAINLYSQFHIDFYFTKLI